MATLHEGGRRYQPDGASLAASLREAPLIVFARLRSLREAPLIVFARLRLAARSSPHRLRSAPPRCAKLPSPSSLGFASLRQAPLMVFARLRLAARSLLSQRLGDPLERLREDRARGGEVDPREAAAGCSERRAVRQCH